MKNVLIVGGSRGIGRSMVELFSERGYAVAFTYKNSDEQARELSLRTGAFCIKADSAIESEVISAVRSAKEKIGDIEVLINNAAVSSFSLFTDLSLEDWRESFAVNLDGAFLYSREVLRDMIKNKRGRIINISSMWGMVGSSCEVHYSSAKAALIGMTKALAKEVGPSGITVNCIAPGVINTEMNQNLSLKDIQALIDETPLMKIGEPKNVADVAYFLAEDTASFITGAVINVSGGYVV